MSIERIDIEPKGPAGHALPFAKAVRAGNFVFASGQMAAGDPGSDRYFDTPRSSRPLLSQTYLARI